MRRFVRVIIASVLLVSVGAHAQEAEGEASAGASVSYGSGGGSGRHSVLAGSTVGSGETVFHGQLGWPGISATLLYGAGPKLDLGGQFSFLYGYEGITRLAGIPGIKLQGIMRVMLLERQRINFGLKFAPGPFFYFSRDGYTEVGLALPIHFALGISLSNEVMFNVGLDIPMFVVFGPYGGVVVPVLLGGGVEYALDRNLALTFNLRVGPSGFVGYYYTPYEYCYDRFGRPFRCGTALVALESLVGLSYRF